MSGHLLLTGVAVITGCSLIGISRRSQQVAALWTKGSTSLFESILEVIPGEFSTLKDLGTVHARQGNFDAAVPNLAHAASLRPTHPGVLLNLATVLHQGGQRLQEAESWYVSARAAAALAEQHCRGCMPQVTELAKAEANLAALYLQSRRPKEAVALLEVRAPWSEAVASARAPSLYHLGLAYGALGHRERAARLYRMAVSVVPRVGGGAASEALRRIEQPVAINGIR